MSNKVLSIAAALAALGGVAAPSDEANAAPTPTAALQSNGAPSGAEPNVFFTAGEDLLAMVVTTQGDGTVIAAHYSHQSHASHVSHHSHYSSRY